MSLYDSKDDPLALYRSERLSEPFAPRPPSRLELALGCAAGGLLAGIVIGMALMAGAI